MKLGLFLNISYSIYFSMIIIWAIQVVFPIFSVGYRPIGCLWVVADDTLKRLVAVACLGELGVILLHETLMVRSRSPEKALIFCNTVPSGKHTKSY